MKRSEVKLSVVIPCYNEGENLPLLLNKLTPLEEGYSNLEIILVNNGSIDKSEQILLNLIETQKSKIYKYVKVEVNQGYGFGILKGLECATGDILCWTHADLQTPPLDIIKGLHLILQHSEINLVVKGKRYGRPVFDLFFTKMMEVYANIVLNTSLSDINAQPKMFSKFFFETHLKNKAPWDFSLDLFLLWCAEKNNIPIRSFPVRFENRIHGEAKGGGNLKLKWKLTKRTLNFINDLRLKYQYLK